MNRKELLKAMQETAAIKPTPVQVPKWGTVYVKPRTLEEVDGDALAEEKAQEKDKSENRNRRLARACAKVICDENGERIFSATTESDVQLLSSQPYHMLRKVLTAAGGEDEDEGKSGAGTS